MDITALAQSATTSPSTNQAFSSLTDNFDTFLTLLTTQLRNQDPLEPLDTEQFTEQLVQFANVEQSIQTNANLETLISLQSSSDRASALDLIGKSVTVETDAARHDGGGAAWTFSVDGATRAALSVVDASGAEVFAADQAVGPGAQDFVWDGRGTDGRIAPPGVYRLVVDAVDASGSATEAAISTQTRVDAVVFNAGASQLETPIGVIALDDIARAAN
ncbi:MAG: flagellar hook capping FlgD N-terminal domain-containing protein [Pseudomonadota bacterium]